MIYHLNFLVFFPPQFFSLLDQFSNVSMHQNHLQGLLRYGLLVPSSRGSFQ